HLGCPSLSGSVASVEPSAQLMKHSGRAYVTRRQPHRPFELAERLPPASLTDVDPHEVKKGELPRLVAFVLLGLFKPRDRLVQLVLLHQVDPDVVVRIAELGIDLDRAKALLRGLRQVALEAHRPPQEGMCLCRRIQLNRLAIELDRSIHISPCLVAVALPPEFRRSSQSLSVFHFSTSLVITRIGSFCASGERGDVVTPARGARRSQTSGRFCTPTAGADRGCGFSRPDLERSESRSEEYMSSGRPSRLRVGVESDHKTPRPIAGALAPRDWSASRPGSSRALPWMTNGRPRASREGLSSTLALGSDIA